MNIFSKLISKISGHSPSAPSTSAVSSKGAPQATPATAAPGTTPAPAAAPAIAEMDVTKILDDLASKNSEQLDWRRSIVDLMKLVGMESSLATRKELAQELHYPGDTSDSATMNVWLHKEVIKKIAANGGKVPAELLD